MDTKIGLNVGSGQRPFYSTQGITWYNIDSQAKWNPQIVCDGAHLTDAQGIPLGDEYIDYVVLHHVLEHFGCGEGIGLIKEAYRVLKPGGSLHVYVPDLRALAIAWLNGKITTQVYVTNLYGAYMGSEDDRHKWGFDSASLREFLETSAQWGMVTRSTGDPPGADIAHDWWILEMECIK